MCFWLGVDDLCHGDVVGFGGEGGEDLGGVADADFQGFWVGLGEGAVVVAFSSAEAGSVFGKAEAGAEEDVDFGERDGVEDVSGFEDVLVSGKEVVLEILDFFEDEFGADDFWEEPAAGGIGGE